MLNVGDYYKHSFLFTQEDVIGFAKVTGDNNPVHLDTVYASGTIFKKPIMHGMLGASIFSKVFGTLFPGNGTIYLSQSLHFIRPMYVNESYEAFFEVIEVDREKHRAKIATKILSIDSKETINGEALIMHVEKI